MQPEVSHILCYALFNSQFFEEIDSCCNRPFFPVEQADDKVSVGELPNPSGTVIAGHLPA